MLRHVLITVSIAALAAVSLWVTTGCEQQSPPPTTQATTTQPTGDDIAAIQRRLATSAGEGDSASEMPALPPGHPPIESDGSPMKMPEMSTPMAQQGGGSLVYDVPEAWTTEQPSSSMRKAQYRLPAAGEGEESPEMVLFHFPGTGGSVDANIERWRMQFRTAAGEPVPAEQVERSTLAVNDLNVTTVEVEGRFMQGSMTGGPAEPTDERYRLLAAIIETPTGPWFFKATGPVETINAARDDFLTMLRSLQFESGE